MANAPFNPGGFGHSNRPSGCSLEDLERIEHNLLREVNEAKAEYKLHLALHPDLLAGGSKATPEVRQTHLTVVDRYRIAIKTFSDFILHGKLPDAGKAFGSTASPSG
jgi:hypothetical protein